MGNGALGHGAEDLLDLLLGGGSLRRLLRGCGRRGRCGKEGCLDAYCSAKVLSDHAGGSLSAFFEELRSGDSEKRELWREYLENLAVAVNTVDTAYQMLVAEGYLEARPKSGFFVLEYADMLPRAAQGPEEASAGPAETPGPPPRFDLSTGAVDTALFPFRTWGRIQKELL